MTPFAYSRAGDAPTALGLISQPHTKFLAGGTNLVDLMRENIEQPDEETLFDRRNGRIVNASLSECHVPVNLDVPPIEVVPSLCYCSVKKGRPGR